MPSPAHLIHYWCYYRELQPKCQPGLSHISILQEMVEGGSSSGRVSVPQRCFTSVFVVVGNSPAAISIKRADVEGAFTHGIYHRLWMYVTAARAQSRSLKVRLKLEAFHHEALWEVLCICGGQ